MPSERTSLEISSKSNKRKNYEEQFGQQSDNSKSNSDPSGGGDDPMSQIILQDRRHRNLLASKKYRAKKQQMEREKNDFIQKLSNENQSLKRKLQEVEFENKSLKEIMNRLTTSSAASVLDNKVMMVRERLCRNGAVDN
ncbi:5809_t:CDS:2 [Funneliformis geosporum]|uniref:5809_t:CDS:1 n=1 Tax=Funneliformis geosporum TaxID=1117311 RepID=A0A9W4SLS6_9GLOM|nr:5809_t:CDS:2 [Funneliformis geosporum]